MKEALKEHSKEIGKHGYFIFHKLLIYVMPLEMSEDGRPKNEERKLKGKR